jgi:replicative DNA helicase
VNDDMLTDQVPPDDDGVREPVNDFLAEQSVLGAMMRDRNVVDDVMGMMLPEDFYHPKHEVIGKTIATLARRGAPTDEVAVSDALRKAGELEAAGGIGYVMSLPDIVPFASSGGYYAEIVKKLAVRRRLVEAGIRIQAKGNATEGEIEQLVEEARAEVDQVIVSKRSTVTMASERILPLIEELSQPPSYLPTPWDALNKLIGGTAPGELVVVAARPGSGKSIALLQWAASNAHAGMVPFSSFEMKQDALVLRLLAQYAPVHMTNLRQHRLSSDDWARVAHARTLLDGAPIFIDEARGGGLAQIRSHARMVQRRGKLAGIFVDYLQLVQAEGKDRNQIVGNVSGGLKSLAMELNVPVIAAAQLRRASEKRRQLPTLEDLRESGSIEQDADVVLLFDRDKEKRPSWLTVVVAKNRNGDQGRFDLRWEAEFARLRDKEWSPLGGIEMEE